MGITVTWMMVKTKRMFVYGLQTGRAETKKGAFRGVLDRMVGLEEAHAMMCIAGYFNGHASTGETGEE